jgi:acetyltransferase-like isoleucine patch superfamily enzyme/dTDP-4-dehydrorhamnose 3,5-epimerase-like enzyme
MADSFFIHPHGIVEPGAQIGERTRVWAFAHVLPGAVIGADCNICDHVFIENHVSMGDRVTIKSGVQLWDGIALEDDVFIGPNVAFTNDPFPRSRQYPESFPRTLVQKGASIGANATILPGKIIGQYAMVGAGAVVTHDVPPHAIATGNPARIVGFTAAGSREVLSPVSDPGTLLNVSDARFISLKTTDQTRGSLSVAEAQRQIPFDPCRYFSVYNVPPHEVRGQHAHRTQHQFLNCLHGSCHVVLDDGYRRDDVILDSPGKGLYVPPRIWGIQYKYSPDAVLLVVVSALYDPADYITGYDEFLELVGAS